MTAAVWNQVHSGKAKDLDAILLPYQQATRYVADNYERLLQEHPEQWVAVTAQGVLASSTRRDAVSRKLKASGAERNKVYITFLTKKKQTLIL